MSVILGIDAAWTAHNPSGVAVLKSDGNTWRCAGVAPSYGAFIALAHGNPVNWREGFGGAIPGVPELLNAAELLAGAPVDIVTIDMPISREQIAGPRNADRVIGYEFGAKGCAAFFPNAIRPGPLGMLITDAFIAEGFAVATKNDSGATSKRILEVYPHPALLALINSPYRVPYKASKAKKIWPELEPHARKNNLLAVYRIINEALCRIVGPTGINLPVEVETFSSLKPYEDALDALISAWVGICYLENYAIPYGDETAAIWVPDKLTHMVTQIAKVPSFSTYEERLWGLIDQYTSQLSPELEVIPVAQNNRIIMWPGNNVALPPVALTAHLDKINHFEDPEIEDLPVRIESDEIVGQLDDAVGIAICLHVLSECKLIRHCPPIMIFLSELEEQSSLWCTDLLKNQGEGIDLLPGANRIADYLIRNEILPGAAVTIDTSAVFKGTNGVALYTDFWERDSSGAVKISPRLRSRIEILVDRVMQIAPYVRHANGSNDYVAYGSRFNRHVGNDIPSIAIEPAICPIHMIGERMKIDDVHRVSNIVLELLNGWPELVADW